MVAGRTVRFGSVLPHIELIVPVYNRTEHLAETLDSVARQKGVDAKVLLVDDGSEATDVGKAFQSHPAVAKFLRIEHRGVSAARNAGLEMAQAPLVGFLDGDDVLEPAFCASLAEALKRSGADLAYCDYDRFFVGPHGERRVRYQIDQGPDTLTPLHRIVRSNLQTGTYLLCRSTASAVGKFNESLRFGEDWEWMLRCAEHSTAWIHVPQVLFHYRETPGSASSNFEAMYEQPREILRRFLERKDSPELWGIAQEYWLNQRRTAASRMRRFLLESFRDGRAIPACARIARFLAKHPELLPYLFKTFPKR